VKARRRCLQFNPSQDVELKENTMNTTNRLMPRAISFAMAAMVTWSLLAGIDTLATTQHAANDLMAQAAVLVARLA
jgi:hypothetical protein